MNAVLSVADELIMQSVVVLNVITRNVLAPSNIMEKTC
jgi:hypothetical protein